MTLFSLSLMDICIIETVWMGGAKYGIFDKLLLTSFSILPTLHARQIAAITPPHHTIHLINERYESINFDHPYDVVHINCTTSTASHAYDIADRFRQHGITVVLSGLHPAAVPSEAGEHADSVLLGRGELNWLDCLQDIEKNTLKKTYPAKQYTSKTTLPPTNVQLPGFVMTGAIEATRGCPYCCSFCPEVNIDGGSQYYKRPIPDVIAELRSIPQKTIMFYDASLTVDTAYTKQLFREMIGLGKRFFCNGNADVLAHDTELVALSKQAGCISWLVGFESISQTTIDTIGKQTNIVTDYQQAVDNIHHHKMAVIGCFIFGFDTDTVDIFSESLQMIKQLRIDICDFCVLTPFPGTPLFTSLQNDGRIITTDWQQYNLKSVVFTPKHMTAEHIHTGVRQLYTEYYSLSYTIQRAFRGLRYGIVPFFFILVRNMIATMNSRRLSTTKA